jgi:hypothetical protein
MMDEFVYRQQHTEQTEDEAEKLRIEQLAAVKACQEISRKNFTYADNRPGRGGEFDRMCQELADSKRANAELVAQRDNYIEQRNAAVIEARVQRENAHDAIEVMKESVTHMMHGDNQSAFTSINEYLKTI